MMRLAIVAVLALVVLGIVVIVAKQNQYVRAQDAVDARLRAATERVQPGLSHLDLGRHNWTAKSYIAAARRFLRHATSEHRGPIVMLGEFSAKRHILYCTEWSGPRKPDFCSIPVPAPPSGPYITLNVGMTTGPDRYRLHFVSLPPPRILRRQGFHGTLIAAEPFNTVGPFPV